MDNKFRNRAAFPFAARIADELRAVFGGGVTVTWASENGAEIGRRCEQGVVAVPYRTAEAILRKDRR